MAIKTISDSRYINTLFNSMSKQKQLPVLVGDFLAEIYFLYKKKGELSIELLTDLEFAIDDKVEIKVFFNDILFKFTTKILEKTEKGYKIAKPTELSAIFNRILSRYKVKENEEIYAEFLSFGKQFKLSDITTKGMAIKSTEEFLYQGQVVRNIKIKIFDAEVTIDATVKYFKDNLDGTYTYGMSFMKTDSQVYKKLFKYIFKNTYPELFNLDELTIEQIYELYRSSQGSEDDEFIQNVKRLHEFKNKSSVFTAVLHCKKDKILNVGSMMRVYSQTVLKQQFLSSSEADMNLKAKVDMYSGLVDIIINRPYFEYCINYIRLDYFWNDIFSKLGEFINDNDTFLFNKFELYECGLDTPVGDGAPDVPNYVGADYMSAVVLDKPDKFIKYCKENLSSLEIQCYDYTKDKFDLSQIGEVYESLDMGVERKLWGIYKHGEIQAYVVAEAYIDGVDDFNDMARVYFIDGCDKQSVVAQILPELQMFYRKFVKDKFNLSFKSDEKSSINIEGVRFVDVIGKVIMNRYSLAKSKKLLGSTLEHYVKYYPLSHPQRSIWNVEKFYPNTSFGNVAGTVRISDNIDFDLLEKAINVFLEKNQGLWLKVNEYDGTPRQYLAKVEYKKIDFFDFSSSGAEGLYKWDEQQNKTPFNLIDSELFYFAMIKIHDTDGGFYMKFHHLITDAWSINLACNQIIENYYLLKNSDKVNIINSPSYIDYLLSEEEFKFSDKFKKSKEFWSNKFATIPECTMLKQTTSNYIDLKAERKTIVMPKELSVKIREYCKTYNKSAFSLFMAIMFAYIYRVTMKNDIVIGTPILNRSNVKEKETIGMFISAIPIRFNVNEEVSFNDFIDLLSKDIMVFLKNQKYSYDFILRDYREIHKTSDLLYDVMVSYQNAELDKTSYLENYKGRWHYNGNQNESLVLHINDRENEGQFIINLDYRLDAFSKDEVDRLYEHFINLLEDGIDNPTKKVHELEILSEWEKNKLLYEFNDTDADYPRDKTIHQLFEEQVERTPDNIAVVFEDQELTYRELNSRANQLAWVLRDKGVKPDTIVGIMVEDPLKMVIGILGILKAGGAYLPIDPDYPDNRIEFMLNDSGINILITQEHLYKNSFKKIIINLDYSNVYIGKNMILKPINDPSDLAYIIYTSGSTGNPKGVMIEHKSISDRIQWRINEYKLTYMDSALQLFSYAFDGFVTSFFTPLLSGAKSIFLSKVQVRNPKKICDCIYKEKVTHFIAIPSLYQSILEFIEPITGSYLTKVTLAGERITPDIVEKSKVIFPNVELINEYGAT